MLFSEARAKVVHTEGCLALRRSIIILTVPLGHVCMSASRPVERCTGWRATSHPARPDHVVFVCANFSVPFCIHVISSHSLPSSYLTYPLCIQIPRHIKRILIRPLFYQLTESIQLVVVILVILRYLSACRSHHQ